MRGKTAGQTALRGGVLAGQREGVTEPGLQADSRLRAWPSFGCLELNACRRRPTHTEATFRATSAARDRVDVAARIVRPKKTPVRVGVTRDDGRVPVRYHG